MFNDNIPQVSELEKKVLLKLAENGPMTGYDFHLGGERQRGSRKAIMSSGSWPDIKKHLGAEGENLIKSVWLKNKSSLDERGRRKDFVWLTPEGLIFALNNDVNPNLLLNNVKKVYPDNPEMALAVEIAQLAGKDMTKAGYLLNTCQYDKLDRVALLSMLSRSKGKKEGAKHLRGLVLLLKKYPQYRKHFKEGMADMRNNLNQVLDAFEEDPEQTEKKE